MEKKRTCRGFNYSEFTDRYDNKCSLQKSSLAFEDCIWLGIDNANPQILASQTENGGTGWVKYDIPKNVSLTTRMHLTRKQVFNLLPHLIRFVITGSI